MKEGTFLIHRRVDEFDIRKLEDARNLIEQVANYYFSSANSKDLCSRLDTIRNKLTSVILEAREWNRTHDHFGNRLSP